MKKTTQPALKEKTALRLLLEKKKMYASTLAEKVGISARIVQSYAQGARTPSYMNARKIEKALKVKAQSLFKNVWK